MKLSTSTNLIHYRPYGSSKDIKDNLKIISQAGFEYVDLNIYDWSRPGSPFLDDNTWKAWTDEIIQTCEQLNLKFYQSHSYVYDFSEADFNSQYYQQEMKLVKRSLEIGKRVGATVMVTHPITNKVGPYSRSKSLKINKDFYLEIIDYCYKNNISLAFENMVDSYTFGRRRFGSTVEELLELMEELNAPNVGICWDFEHGVKANIEDQSQLLYLIHDHLIATHVSDCHSRFDTDLMHVLPFLGNLKWENIIKSLREIEYDHMFSLEVHHFTHNMPDELLIPAAKFTYELASALINLGVK